MKKIIISLLLLIVVCLTPVTLAQYVDKTPSMKNFVMANIYNIYVGGSITSGSDYAFQMADGIWGGIGSASMLGSRHIFDSLILYTDHNPLLERYWCAYSNATQCNYDDDDGPDLMYLNTAAVFDSLAHADGIDDTLLHIVDGIDTTFYQWEDMFIHMADATVTFTVATITRVINADSLRAAGSDSLTRFPIFSAGIWRNVDSSDPFYPTGGEFLFRIKDSVVASIIARGAEMLLDSCTQNYGMTNQLKSLGYDNMGLYLSGNCQTPYWQPNYISSTGGDYSGDVEWDIIGDETSLNIRPLIAADCNDCNEGYYNVVEATADRFDASIHDYKLQINLSNTPASIAYDYALRANDSTVLFGLELRGNDLIYYPSTSSQWKLVVDLIDTTYTGSPTGGCTLEYRQVIDKNWCADVEPSPCTSDPLNPDTLTEAWGNWQATVALASFLWIQRWDHTYFNYGRSVYRLSDTYPIGLYWNDRWYVGFETDFGMPVDTSAVGRLDSTIAGEKIFLRIYTKGGVAWCPNNHAFDTNAASTRLDLGKTFYEIVFDGPDAVDTVFNDSGIIYIRPQTGRVWLWGDQPPIIINRTAAETDVGVEIDLTVSIDEASNVCSTKVYFNSDLIASQNYGDTVCIPVASFGDADTIFPYTPDGDDIGNSTWEVYCWDDSGKVGYKSFDIFVNLPNMVIPTVATMDAVDTVNFLDTVFYSLEGTNSFVAAVCSISIDGGDTYLPELVGSQMFEPTDTIFIWTPDQAHVSDACMVKICAISYDETYGNKSACDESNLFQYVWVDTTISWCGSVDSTGTMWQWTYGMGAFTQWTMQETISGTIYLDSIMAKVSDNSTPDDTLFAAVYSDVSDAPYDLLETSDSVVFTTGFGVYTWVTMPFSGNIVLDSGAVLWFGVWSFPSENFYGMKISRSDTVSGTYYLIDAIRPLPNPFSGGTYDGNAEIHVRLFCSVITSEGEETALEIRLIKKKRIERE